jgi:hypothetical protein
MLFNLLGIVDCNPEKEVLHAYMRQKGQVATMYWPLTNNERHLKDLTGCWTAQNGNG